ncbi:DEAD/DEAH box helicase [Myceligenerans crystallogenes]|uniref:DEAD/DEAH box helicase n=1 Tax=Myceligenerans crystallogenes TaxID=316335 RepID=A0ABN2NEK4_9MICO
MAESLDAIRTSREITTTYRRYLQTLLAVRDSEISDALADTIDRTPMLDKGPYLEATPPYAPGGTLRSLIDEGVLSPGFAKLGSTALPLDRPLYVHQEKSIRKAAQGRNVVVATGTGSGKTESFLLPILDSLVREHEAGTLGPGVRALLLYPMNALANDQMKRLRQILAAYPDITFGRYTGDTETDPARAREAFGNLNIGEPILPNELLSRTEMRQTPPHLLLTNYAMLEYLLLRPLDLELFGSGKNSPWRFIVVDEAHVYDGSQGAEVAMLLRRVRDRVAPDRPIQCLATSATVGADTDPAAVTRFATNLFGESFEWEPDDSARQDLISAQRVAMPNGPFWGPLDAKAYIGLAEDWDREEAVLSAARSAGWQGDGSAADAILHEKTLATLRSRLTEGPDTFRRVQQAIFGNDPDGERGLASLVELASALRQPDGTTAISARYHLFLRATEGAFTCLSPSGPHVQLARHTNCGDCDAPVFEIGSCRRCGSVHVLGTPEIHENLFHLRPRKAMTRGTWYVLGDQPPVDDEDEDATVDLAPGDGKNPAESTPGDDVPVTAVGEDETLCTACSAINPGSTQTCKACGSSSLRTVRKLKQRGDEIAGCLVCGARGPGTVRVFETGSDASGAVIATSLYQNLPAADDQATGGSLPGEGRKLLAFSDSRQAAAYFAPYLQDSYGKVQRRRLITEGLAKARADEDPVSVDDLIFTTRSAAKKVQFFKNGLTAQGESRIVAPWIMAEAVATDDRQSLEGLGLVGILLERPSELAAPGPLAALGLSNDEAWNLLQELVRTLRQQGAVEMPESVPSNDEIFAPRLGPIRVRGEGSEPMRKVLSWLPTKGTNRRVDYLTKVLAALGSEAEPTELLRNIWRMLTASASPVKWLSSNTEKSLGVVHQINHELLRFSLVTDKTPVYRCSVCRRTTPVSVRDVCPALRCEGTLERFSPPPVGEDRDHYRTVYRTLNAVSLSAIEHTAQWTNTRAAEIQHQFVKGEVNTLSCSTTFELGVDVGELQAVMLRNMPPMTANYLQRAGRAGRRSGAAALVVTFAQRRSHDLTKFADPRVMISGQVRAPYIPLVNERIDRRHAQSIAMAAFFRWVFESTGRIYRKAGEFFLPGEGGSAAPVTLVEGFLNPVPAEVSESLARVIPPEIAAEVGVRDGSWAARLVELLERVRRDLAKEVEDLENLSTEASDKKVYWMAERYQKVSNTLRNRDLLGYLANRNVLPKYGFPVDSVELRTDFGYGKDGGADLDLTRDLSSAIHEYAPDAELVAGGRLWTSRGLHKLPGRDLQEFKYQVCGNCGAFWQGLEALDSVCSVCEYVNQTSPRVLTIPEFGFVADSEPKRPGARPPRRSWSGAVHVLAKSPEASTRELQLTGGRIEAEAGPRGRLVSVADGPGKMGFWICDWCGFGTSRANHPKVPPAKHKRPSRDLACTGPMKLLDLAHQYETDLVSLRFSVRGGRRTQGAWKSVLYAIVEAASDTLEIARDDIGGSLVPEGPEDWSISLFDRVPGGAGHVLNVYANLKQVLDAALRRVTTCECGPETSCYGCLRSFSNQRDHDELSRGEAAEILSSLLGAESAVPAGWEQIFSLANPEEHDVLQTLAEHSVPVPDIAFEHRGIPLTISWADQQIALEMGDLDEAERHDLAAEGWVILPLGTELWDRLAG